jgi:fibronectin-binding autotransporter adhesin
VNRIETETSMMKFCSGLATLVVGLCWCTAVSATTYIYEPFDYTAGVDLLGQTNTSAGTTAGAVPNSWLRAAPAASPASSIKIGNGSLSRPAEAATLKGPIGLDVAITGTSGITAGPADRLAFKSDATTGSNITSGSIFYSFLLNVSDLTAMQAGTTSGAYFMSLNNTANAATTTNPSVVPGQMRIRIDPTDSTKYDLGMFTQRSPSASDAAWSSSGGTPISLDVNRTYFVVGQFTLGSTNSTKLWINPDQTFFGGAAAAPITRQDTTSGSNGTTIGSLLLHQNAVGTLALDELRVASTWSEVTPLGTATLYWVGSGGASPNGTWDTNAGNAVWNNVSDGSGNAVPWTADSAAVFSAGTTATGAYTVTVSGTQSASGMTFEDGTATLAGGQVNLTGLHTISVNTGVTANIGSAIGGTVGMVKDGTGTLVLTGNQAYSGATVISGGVLQLGDGGTAGTLPTGSSITDSARLTFNRSNAVTQGTDFSGSSISGSGGLTQAGAGTLTLNAANTYSGTTRASAGALLLTNSLAIQNSTLDMNATDTGAVSVDSSLSAVTFGGLTGSRNLSLLNSTGGALAVSVGNDLSSPAAPYTGVLSGNGSSLTKIGSSTQVLSGANTYTGNTTINAGTLQFATTVAMPVGGGASADYNANGNVDAADYVLWRKNPAGFGGNPAGYTAWRAGFGGAGGGGGVTVNSGGTLAANAGGTGEWTESTDTSVGGTIGSLVAGRGGQGTANEISWMPGSTLAIDTTNAAGAPTAPALTYTGVIGGFRTAGGGTTDAVGFTKRGIGTLTLSGNNTFSGPLTVAGGVNGTSTSTLQLTGTNLNAGTTQTIPTISIAAFSTLQQSTSNILPSGSLITTNGSQAKFHLDDSVVQTVRSISGNNGVLEVGFGKLIINDQAGDNYVWGIPGGAYIMTGDGVGDPNRGIVDKIGAGTLTLEGDAGTNFNGTFIMENGRLNLSRNQALGTTGGTGRLVVKGGQLGRTDTPTGNFTYSLAFLDLDVFRYDMSDAPARTSQINASTITTLKQNNVEFNITNTGTIDSNTGRFNFLGDIRNNDPISEPGAPDRSITKTGNGILTFNVATTYRGSTTISDGILMLTANAATLGDNTQATIGTLNLNGGMLATNISRTSPIINPIVINGPASLGHVSTTSSLASVVMELNSNSVVGTSGSLTISNLNAGTGNTVFRPLFTGNGFNFGLPITVSSSTGTTGNVKSNELEFGNSTGTQTFSGVISGGGSVRRVNAGGTTILSAINTYTGNTSIDDGTLSITNPYLADTSDVSILSSGHTAVFDLNFAGSDTINRLFIDGLAQAVGTYGSTASGATFPNDTLFTGLGKLSVTSASGSGFGLDTGAVPEPASAALTIFGIALVAIGSRRRRSGR